MIIKKLHKRIFIAIIAIGIFFGASCLKKQDLTAEDLGTAVPPETVAEALSEGFGAINYSEMKTNEICDMILSQKIQDSAPQNLEQQDITIREINNQPSFLQIKSRAKLTSYSGNNNSTDEREWDQVFNKYSGFAFSMKKEVQQQAELTEPLFMFQLIQNLALGSCYDGGNYPETCHNLNVSEIDYRVPPTAAHQHSCSDLYNCFIKAKKIEFDMIQKYNIDSDGKARRIHFSLILSTAVPFTSRVLQYCTRSVYDLQGVPQKVLADLCYKVNNYAFGQ